MSDNEKIISDYEIMMMVYFKLGSTLFQKEYVKAMLYLESIKSLVEVQRRKEKPMKRKLSRRSYSAWHYRNGEYMDGPPPGVRGDLSGVQGDLTGVQGDLTGVYGDLTGVHGNLSGVCGDLTGVYGDLSGVYGDLTGVQGNLDKCEITDKDRQPGIDINDLIESKE